MRAVPVGELDCPRPIRCLDRPAAVLTNALPPIAPDQPTADEREAYNAERSIDRVSKDQLVRCVWGSAPIRDRSAMPSGSAPGFVQIDPTAARLVGSFLSARPVSRFEPGSIELDPALRMLADEMKINGIRHFAFPRSSHAGFFAFAIRFSFSSNAASSSSQPSSRAQRCYD
jgi:hypothetical protein